MSKRKRTSLSDAGKPGTPFSGESDDLEEKGSGRKLKKKKPIAVLGPAQREGTGKGLATIFHRTFQGERQAVAERWL